MVFTQIHALVDFATIGEETQQTAVVGYVGVQYAKNCNLCQVKSDTSSGTLDNIRIVGVQFSREAIGDKEE